MKKLYSIFLIILSSLLLNNLNFAQTFYAGPAKGFSSTNPTPKIKLFFAEDENILIEWTKNLPNAKIKIGNVKGVYDQISIDVSGISKSFIPNSPSINLSAGRYYAVITNSAQNTLNGIIGEYEAKPTVIDYSNEVEFIIESETAPSAIAPKGNIFTNTPEFQWTSVAGIQSYWLLISSTPFEVSTDADDNVSVKGANVIWQILTTENTVSYGELNSNSPLNTPAPPLVSNQEYYYTILNVYDKTNLAYTSAAFGGVITFIYVQDDQLEKPLLASPTDNSLISGEEKITFSWDEVSGANNYSFYLFQRVTSFAGNEQEIDLPVWNTTTTENSIELDATSTLTNGKYVWYVVANDASGNGSMSDFYKFEYQVNVGVFTIRAYSAETGSPIVGYLVYSNSLDDGTQNSNPFIVPETSYTDSLVWGNYVFRAEKSGYLDSSFVYEINSTHTLSNPQIVNLYLKPITSNIIGIVKDGSNNAIYGAEVTLRNKFSGEVFSDLTNSNGDFSTNVSLGKYDIVVVKPGYKASELKDVVVDKEQYVISDPLILYFENAIVSGKILNDQLSAISLAEVSAQSGDILQKVTSDNQGNYSLSLSSGAWIIKAEKQGFFAQADLDVNLSPSQILSNQNIILLPKANQISGYVYLNKIGLGNIPLENAEVIARPLSGNLIIQKTDPFGKFNFNLGEGTYEFSVNYSGYFSNDLYSFSLSIGRTISDVNFYLSPKNVQVSGFVYSSTGEQLVDANIYIDGRVNGVTSASGSYSILTTPGNHSIMVSKNGYIPNTPQTLYLTENQILNNVNFEIVPNGSSVSGKIIADGSFVTDVKVTAYYQNKSYTVYSDENGNYRINLPAGQWNLFAQKNGFLSETGERSFTLQPGQNLLNQNFTLSLEDLVLIKGQVLSGSTPVNNSKVQLTDIETNSRVFSSLTGVNGNFSINVPKNKIYDIHISKEGYSTLQTSTGTPVNETIFNTYNLNRIFSSIEGKVTDLNGNVLTGVGLTLINTINGSNVESKSTSFDGKYKFSIPSGSYLIKVIKTGYVIDSLSIQLTESQTISNVNFTLRENFSLLSGKVLSDLEPVSNASLSLTDGNKGFSTFSLGDGSYSFSKIPEGNWSIAISKEGYTNFTQSGISLFNGESKNLDFDVQPAQGNFSGTIIDLSANPVDNAAVMVTNNTSGNDYQVITNVQGEFKFNNIELGDYSGAISKSGYNSRQISFSLTTEQPSLTLNITDLTIRDIVFSGNVKDQTGNPVPYANINLSGTNGSSTAITDVSGNFSVNELSSGSYSITINKEGFSNFTTSIELNTSSNENFTLFKNQGEVFGVIKDQLGNNLSFSAKIKAITSSKTYSVSSDASGNYKFLGLPIGTSIKITSDIYSSEYKNSEYNLTLSESNNSIRQDISVLIAKSSIKGEVNVSGALVKLLNEAGNTISSINSSTTGSFLFNNLIEGTYTVKAEKDGYVFQPSSISVSLGIDETKEISFAAASNVGNLTVKVVDINGSNISQANVVLTSNTNNNSRSTFTNSTGTAVFSTIPAGNYFINVSKNGYNSSENNNIAITSGGNSNSTITLLVSSSSISGTVVNANTQQIIKDITVKLRNIKNGNSSTNMTDQLGVFSFSNLSAGDYLLTVTQNGFISDSLNLSLATGEQLSSQRINVIPNSVAIMGRIVHKEQGLSNIKITATGFSSDETLSDQNGNFVFSNFPIKTKENDTTSVLLAIVSDDFSLQSKLLRIPSMSAGSSLLNNDFILPGGQINISLTDGLTVLSGVSIEIKYPDGNTIKTFSNNNGKFSTNDKLPIGEYVISLTKSGYLKPEGQSLKINLADNNTVANQSYMMPFTHIPLQELSFGDSALAKVKANSSFSGYAVLYYKEISSVSFKTKSMQFTNGFYEAYLSAKNSVSGLSYYVRVFSNDGQLSYVTNEYNVKVNVTGIPSAISINPALEQILLRKNDSYKINLLINDENNESLNSGILEEPQSAVITWKDESGGNLEIIPDGLLGAKIKANNSGTLPFSVEVKYNNFTVSNLFSAKVVEEEIEEIILSSGKFYVSNRSTGVKLNYSGKSTEYTNILLGNELAWSVEPLQMGQVTEEGIFIPSDSTSIGFVKIKVYDPLSDLNSEIELSLYAFLSPDRSHFLTDKKGMNLNIFSNSFKVPIQLKINKQQFGPSKKNFTDFVTNNSYVSSDIQYNFSYESTVALPGDSLTRPAELELPFDNSLKLFEGEKYVGYFDLDKAGWKVFKTSSTNSTAIKYSSMTRFGQYSILTGNEPLGVKYLSVLPTPFSPQVGPCKIGYMLNTNYPPANVSIKIYNVEGELVKTILENDFQFPGRYGSRTGIKEISWDGLTDAGTMARNGRYILRITVKDQTGEKSELTQIVLVK